MRKIIVMLCVAMFVLPAALAQWTQQGNNVFLTNGSANVGIGTNSPAARLHAFGPNAEIRVQATTGWGGLSVQGEGVSDSNRGWIYQPARDPSLIFWTNGASRAKLEGSANATVLRMNPQTGNVRMTLISQNGYAGYEMRAAGVNQSAWVWQERGDPSLRFWTGDADRMVITGSGRVGIGTLRPEYRLDVAGDTRVSGALETRILNAAWITAGGLDARNVSAGNVVTGDLIVRGNRLAPPCMGFWEELRTSSGNSTGKWVWSCA